MTSEPTLYERGKPQFEEPVHWDWLDELVRAGVLVLVEPDYEAAAHVLPGGHDYIKRVVDAALRIGDNDEET